MLGTNIPLCGPPDLNPLSGFDVKFWITRRCQFVCLFVCVLQNTRTPEPKIKTWLVRACAHTWDTRGNTPIHCYQRPPEDGAPHPCMKRSEPPQIAARMCVCTQEIDRAACLPPFRCCVASLSLRSCAALLSISSFLPFFLFLCLSTPVSPPPPPPLSHINLPALLACLGPAPLAKHPGKWLLHPW